MKKYILLIFLNILASCSSLQKFKPENHTYRGSGMYENSGFNIPAQRLVLNEAAKKARAIEQLLSSQKYQIAESLDKKIYPRYRYEFAENVIGHAKKLHDRYVFKETPNRESEINNEIRNLEKWLESQTSWMNKNDKALFASNVSYLTNTLLMISERGISLGENVEACLPDQIKNLKTETIFTGKNKRDALEKIFWENSKTESENRVTNEKQEVFETSKSEFLINAEVYVCKNSVAIVVKEVVHD